MAEKMQAGRVWSDSKQALRKGSIIHMDSTASIIIISCLVVVGIIVAIYCILRNKKINENGIEADAVISRIDTNYDSEGSPSQVYFVDYVNAEGNTVTAKLGNPPMNAFQGMTMRIKYLPEKPKYVRRVK